VSTLVPTTAPIEVVVVIGVRAAFRSSLRIELSLLTPVAGAITAIPVVAVFALGLALFGTRAAIAMAVGANLIAIVSLVGAPRLPIRLAFIDAAVMGASVFVGAATEPHAWLHTLVLVPWCFGAGMLVVFGQTQATVGTQAVIVYLVLGRYAGSPSRSLHLALLVVAGALVEMVALVILRLPPSLRYQRNRLADAFEAVAGLSRRDPHLSATDVMRTLDASERALSAPSLFGRTDVRDLRAALDQARRTRLELTTLRGLRARLSTEDAFPHTAIDASLEAAEAVLLEIATALRHPRRPTAWRSAAAEYGGTLAPLEEASDRTAPHGDLGAYQCVPYLQAIGGQIRAAGNLVDTARTTDGRRAWRPRISTPDSSDPGRSRRDLAVALQSLRTDSPSFRHAVRLAVAVPASAILASWLSLPRGYWVPYAVAVILKPDYSTLFGRGMSRIVGTLLGATLAAVLVSWLHPDMFLTTVLVALTAWAAYSAWTASFAVAIGFVTALVLILLSTSLSDTPVTALDRLVDVTVGGAIAVIAYVVWPTSPRVEVGEAQSHLFAALRDYLAVVLDVVEHEPCDPARVSAASRATRLAWAQAEAAVERSIQEPASTRIDPSEGRGLLAVALRIVRAIHALRIEAERGATVRAFGELDALTTGFLDALDALGDPLAARPPRPAPELRGLFGATEHQLVELGAPPSIGRHLDELVNAIDTATHLTGRTAE